MARTGNHRAAPPYDLVEQILLGAKIIAHQRLIDTRFRGDVTYLSPIEPNLGKDQLRLVEDDIAQFHPFFRASRLAACFQL